MQLRMTVSSFTVSVFIALLLNVLTNKRLVDGQTTITQELYNDNSLGNMLLVGDSLLVGSDTNIYRLDPSTLDIINTVNITGLNRLLIPVENTGDLGGNVLACQKEQCILLNSTSLNKIQRRKCHTTW